MTKHEHAPVTTNRVAVWYWKGGVGKSTTTMLLSLLAASCKKRVLTIDLDPECGTSRDFLGRGLHGAAANLKTYLASDGIEPPPIVASGIDGLDLLPGCPDDGRFFRHFPESSTKLRDGLDLLSDYRWMFMDVPHQLDNIAQLGLIAADYVILPLELTEDCLERLPITLNLLAESQAMNPNLTVLGGLPLALAPRSARPSQISATEEDICRQYENALAAQGISLFHTTMYLSAKHSVEKARINADLRLMHWTARKRYQQFFAEVVSRIRSVSHSRSLHDRITNRSYAPTTTTAAA